MFDCTLDWINQENEFSCGLLYWWFGSVHTTLCWYSAVYCMCLIVICWSIVSFCCHFTVHHTRHSRPSQFAVWLWRCYTRSRVLARCTVSSISAVRLCTISVAIAVLYLALPIPFLHLEETVHVCKSLSQTTKPLSIGPLYRRFHSSMTTRTHTFTHTQCHPFTLLVSVTLSHPLSCCHSASSQISADNLMQHVSHWPALGRSSRRWLFPHHAPSPLPSLPRKRCVQTLPSPHTPWLRPAAHAAQQTKATERGHRRITSCTFWMRSSDNFRSISFASSSLSNSETLGREEPLG